MKKRAFIVILILILTSFAIHAVQPTFLSVAGVIESSIGGFKFPDGTLQESAASSPVGCTVISSVQIIITVEGVYCFTGNLSTSITTGYAIEIQSDNVTIDMNGWMLEDQSADLGTESIGVYAWQRENITIRNGTIAGFYVGVHLDDEYPNSDSRGHLVEDIHVNNVTDTGLQIEGTGNIGRHNRVTNIGGSTVDDWFYGMYFFGPGSRILDNDISSVASTVAGQAMGVAVQVGDHSVVEGNRINDIGGSGIILVSGNDTQVVGNRLSDMDKGIDYFTGTGQYMDNLATNVTAPYTGGTPAGTTNY